MASKALSIGLFLVMATQLLGCGDDLSCADGTVKRGDTCVAAASACGPGTSFNSDTGLCQTGGEGGCPAGSIFSEALDRCVVDGATVCAGNTVWDEASESCVVDPNACREGTVLVDDQCVPFDETLVGDHNEVVGENDLATAEDEAAATEILGRLEAAAVSIPDEGANTSLEGCINPIDTDGDGAADVDNDIFMLNAGGPSVIRVRVTALGGVAAGFAVQHDPRTQQAQGWGRRGINLRGDDVERELYIPASGNYLFTVGDARNLVSGARPVGGPEACYYVEIERLPLPAATPATLGTEYNGPSDKVHLYTVTGAAAQFMTASVGGKLDADMQVAGDRPVMAISALVNNAHRQSTSEGQGGQAFALIPSLAAGDMVTFAVDHEVNTTLAFDEFTFVAGEIAATEMPEDGTFTVTQGETFPSAVYFQATGGELANIIASMGLPEDEDRPTADMLLVDPFGQLGGEICNGCSEANAWANLHAGGYYYLLVFVDGAEENDEQEVTISRSIVMPEPIVAGDTKAIDLTTHDRAFFTTDFAGTEWLRFNAENLVGIVDVEVSYYDREGFADASGVLDNDINRSLIQRFGGETEPVTEIGRVTIDEERKFLVSISNGEDHTGAERLDFSMNNRVFENMGMLTAANPVVAKDFTVAAEDTIYFLGRAAEATALTPTITPTAGDVALATLDIQEAERDLLNDTGAGEVETTTIVKDNRSDLVIWAVTITAETGTVNVKVDVADPPYSQAGGAKPYADICPNGTEITFSEETGFSDPITLAPLNFNFFGLAVTEALVSQNGWLTFDSAYSDSPRIVGDLPTVGTSVVAAYSAPFAEVTICYTTDATKAVVQWDGVEIFSFFGMTFEFPYQTQVVLNANGTIDYIYGPNHEGDDFGTVGLESPDGALGINRAEPTLPGTSITWTPVGL